MDPIHNLEDLTSFLEDFLQDSTVWCQLQWIKNDSEEPIQLAKFLGQFDYCDLVVDEMQQEVGIEFVFFPPDTFNEPAVATLPVDPDDVEVNILDNALEISSLEYSMILSIITQI